MSMESFSQNTLIEKIQNPELVQGLSEIERVTISRLLTLDQEQSLRKRMAEHTRSLITFPNQEEEIKAMKTFLRVNYSRSRLPGDIHCVRGAHINTLDDAGIIYKIIGGDGYIKSETKEREL